ncbi:MAG: LacI family DNA-binding transcriptional regulator [Roseiflexaceae bacterium]
MTRVSKRTTTGDFVKRSFIMPETDQHGSPIHPSSAANRHSRPPTSTDVARLAGVSRATVSYVLNDLPDSRISAETRARVLAAAETLGYTPHAVARTLRAGQSNTILIPQHNLPIGHTLNRLYTELARHLRLRGYTLVIQMDTGEQGVDAARSWASLRPAGILVSEEQISERAVALLRTAGTRAIVVSAIQPSPYGPTLLRNTDTIGRCAAEAFLARGYRRIAVVIPKNPHLHGLAFGRLHGVTEAVAPYGLTVERIDLDYDFGAARRLAEQWQHGDHPRAIFSYNDEYGMLLLQALHNYGFAVPDQIALIGADNTPICELLHPQLSSVDLGDLATIADLAELFDQQIKGQKEPNEPLPYFHPLLIERGSH